MTFYGIPVYVWIIFFIALTIGSIFTAVRIIKKLIEYNSRK